MHFRFMNSFPLSLHVRACPSHPACFCTARCCVSDLSQFTICSNAVKQRLWVHQMYPSGPSDATYDVMAMTEFSLVLQAFWSQLRYVTTCYNWLLKTYSKYFFYQKKGLFFVWQLRRCCKSLTLLMSFSSDVNQSGPGGPKSVAVPTMGLYVSIRFYLLGWRWNKTKQCWMCFQFAGTLMLCLFPATIGCGLN